MNHFYLKKINHFEHLKIRTIILNKINEGLCIKPKINYPNKKWDSDNIISFFFFFSNEWSESLLNEKKEAISNPVLIK